MDKIVTLVNEQCPACLSVGRKLLPSKTYGILYKKLTGENISNVLHIEALLLCWECHSLLKKLAKFQQQVRKANELFMNRQNVNYGSLSTLKSVLITETHPNTMYIEHTNIQTDNKSHIIDVQSSNVDNDCGSPYNDDYKEAIVKAENNDIKIKKKVYNNKWAAKKAAENKKPKFELLKKHKLNDVFRKIYLSDTELYTYLEKEKDGEYYKSKKYKCTQCILGFDHKKSHLAHNKKHQIKNNIQFTCNFCSSTFNRKSHLTVHIKKHYYAYQCLLCDFTCLHTKQCKEHRMKAHCKIFQCLKCNLKLGKRREFYKHYKEMHEKFICDYCGISFKMKYCIKNHIRKQHSPFECKPCNRRFARYNGLWLHNKTSHTSSAEGAYCVECDRRYADVYRYRWHLANSAKHKPRKRIQVPCPGCEKVFTKNIYMRDHYNLVHLKCYKYRCEQCDKNFIRNADLVKHRRRVHEGILPPKNKLCYVCGRGFTTNEILRNHMRTHTGERPHSCACGAAFAQRTARAHHAARCVAH